MDKNYLVSKHKRDENGFLYLGNRSVFPPEMVLDLVGNGKNRTP